jgi:multiple sugar transport system ATP-binding protein
MATLRLDHVSKRFGAVAAVDDLDLAVGDGELVALVGPSGCGKSTAMRLVAGLDAPTSGHIHIGERDVTGLRPQERDVAMVFQSYALYPHKTVRDNLGFGLRVRGEPRQAIAAKVDEVARLLELGPLLDRRPRQLSGGQRQRVALGRAIVRAPQVFLLDEPMSNLDAQLRAQTRTELLRLQRRLGATMLYVTHDQEEAMTLGDRVAVMRGGRLEQIGAPLDVYHRPATAFVAGFVGSPAMNLVPATAADGRIRGDGFALELPVGAAGAVLAGIRPHDLEVVAPGDGDGDGTVELVEALGREVLAQIEIAGAALRLLAPSDARLRAGDRIGLRWRRDRVHLFDASSGDRLIDDNHA